MRSGRRVRHVSPILWAFLCALVIRLALPAGTMVSAGGAHGPEIVLCSGTGVFEAVLDADGKPKPIRHDGRTGHGRDVCPFASGHAYARPAAPDGPLPGLVAWSRETRAPPQVRVGALRLVAPPPPSHAPPSLTA